MRHLQKAFVFAGLLLSSVSAFSQTASFKSGYFGFFTGTSLAGAMKNDGIKIKVGSYTANQGFDVVAGSLDMSTGQGEIQSAGVVSYVAGGMRLDLRDIQYQNYATSSAVTAAVYLNGAYQGRQTVMTAPFNTYLTMTAYGSFAIANVYTTYTPAFVNEFVNFFQTPDLTPIMNTASSGFINFNLVTQAAPLAK